LVLLDLNKVGIHFLVVLNCVVLCYVMLGYMVFSTG